MQKVAQELQSVIELAEAQQVEIKILKKQLEEIRLKSETLERELGFFRAKEQKSSQYLGKDASEIKNQAQLIRKPKYLDDLAEATKKEVCPVATLKNKETTPMTHISSAKNTQKQSYISVVIFKLAHVLKYA